MIPERTTRVHEGYVFSERQDANTNADSTSPLRERVQNSGRPMCTGQRPATVPDDDDPPEAT